MMRYADHVYRSADDRLDLYARIYDAEGPPLLLMHGLTRNSADFEALASHLAGKYKLIVPDQRGRGRSDHDPDPQNYTPAIYVDDMFALVDGLQLGTVGMIGTSMGGLMAMMMAVHGDIMIGYDAQDWLAFARHVCKETADGKICFAYDPAISEGLSGSDQTVVPPDLWAIWDQLSAIPTLVIRGALSDILSPATVVEMQSRHPDQFSAVEIAGRGHTPMLDEADALAAIDQFYANMGK